MGRTRVLLADHHRSFVEALAIRLSTEPTLEVVAVAVNPDEAVRAVENEHVDVAVLAVDDAHGEFLDAVARLHAARPGLGLVAVSGQDDVGLVVRAVKHGFRGWIPKDAGILELLDVLAGVGRGETRIPAVVLTRVLQSLLERDEEQRAAELMCSTLTSREREVLSAMSQGATRTQIAEQLAISPNTVRTHTQRILAKLDVHTSLAAVTMARRAVIR
jgi:DNA-binding NarL/FixJ family response regulator